MNKYYYVHEHLFILLRSISQNKTLTKLENSYFYYMDLREF